MSDRSEDTIEPPSEAELKAASCWFPSTDPVSKRPDITAFRQWARLRQSRWREARGYPMGTSLRPRVGQVPNGSRLASGQEELKDDYRNFLDNDLVREAVDRRTSTAEKGQQLLERRLRLDLLSSMPMCFNLFGELHGDLDRLTELSAPLVGRDLPGRDVRFEHSPGRQDPAYTGDGTAFDVALVFGAEGGPKQLVGIETKYHEYAVAESEPKADKLTRYEEVADRAREEGVFRPGWRGVFRTNMQQIWRDHLLVLSMLQHPNSEWSGGKYVLVHPARNPAFAEAADRYRTEFLEDDSTFAVYTIEELLGFGVLGAEAEVEFRERYLW